VKVHVRGRFEGEFSHAVVSRGMVEGLIEHGFDVSVSSTVEAAISGLPTGVTAYASNVDLGDTPQVVIGGYPQNILDWKAQGEGLLFGLVISESYYVPSLWYNLLDGFDYVIVPSRWVAEAYRLHSYILCPHGVDKAFLKQDRAPRRNDQPIQFFHVCGAADFLDRKGTPQLIRAFASVYGEGQPRFGQAHLTIRAHETHDLYELLRGTQKYITLEPATFGLQPDDMARRLSVVDAVIQPSRAEAFGIVPCEARAMGIPVLTTHCSGHLQHAEGTDVVIRSGADAVVAVNHLPTGLAPSVTAEAIEDALQIFAERRDVVEEEALRNRSHVRDKYPWRNCVKDLADVLRAESEEL
jgi:glycosyltransferase involved in cell wall biosynthesis